MNQIYRKAGSQLQIPAGETILIRGARQLITMLGPAGPRRGAALNSIGIIPDGAILIRDGLIAEAGPTRRVENLRVARNAREVNAAGRVVMPGFVDARMQLWPRFAGLLSKGSSEGFPAVPRRLLASRAQKVLAGMARHGTTTVCAATVAASDRESELKMLRVLAGLNHNPLDVFGAYMGASFAQPGTGDATTRMDALCTEVMPVISRRKLARFAAANCRLLEPAVTRRFLTCAQRLGFSLRVCARACPSSVRLALEMEAANVALDEIPNEEIGDLAKSHTIALLQPPSAGAMATRALIESGAAIALASGFGFDDGSTYNMQMVVSLACSELGMSAAEAISAATINAAYALGCGAECGSLEPGKRGDIILLNVEDYRDFEQRFGINHVHLVLKNGAVIYREGEVSQCGAA